ncbi:hypothetical protein QZH41_018764, partial [Actinostola sp. cb2023]
ESLLATALVLHTISITSNSEYMLSPKVLPTCVFYMLITVFIFTHLFVPFREVMSTDSGRYRSSDFQTRPLSFMEGGEGISSTKVQDAFKCLFFCLHESRCASINFARNPDKFGRHQCTIYAVYPVENGVFKLVPSERYDFYSIPSISVPKSCSHAKYLGYRESKHYVIYPDGPIGAAQPFSVYCNMTSHNGIGVTVVSHNSEARTMVTSCEDNGCYRRDVVYDGISSDLQQLRALTSISTHCEQYIKYECLAAVLRLYSEIPYTWLVSRDGRLMKYWGGASRDSDKCACGMTGSCANNASCNCDANDSDWREDSGLLTYKEDLPVITLRCEFFTYYIYNHRQPNHCF